jgi:sterol 24-C-methyltransferase
MYHIQAFSYALDLDFLLAEIYRVLKPGAKISFLDWFLLEKFDKTDKEHMRNLKAIKQLLGAVYDPTVPEYMERLKKAGFEVQLSREASKMGH